MGPPITDPDEVGGGCKYIKAVLTSGSPGDPTIFFIDVGQEPPNCEEPGKGGSPPGRETDHGTTPLEPIQWDLELSIIDGGNAGSGARGYGGIYWETAEYGGKIHFHQAYPVPLSGGG